MELFQQLTSWKKRVCSLLKVENFIAASSFLVALASLAVSWRVYRQDQGRLDVSVGLGEIWGGQPYRVERKVIFIRIVNVGRRPVMLSSIGGDMPYFKLKRVMQWVPFLRIDPTSYLFTNSIIDSSLMPNGQPKVLHEGEFISITLPWSEHKDAAKVIAKDSSSVYVFDSMNRKHPVRSGLLRKFRRDFQKWSLS